MKHGPFTGTISENVTYAQNPETGDHVFKGIESNLREQVESLDMGVDDEPQRHVITGVLLDDTLKKIWAPSGDQCGYLIRPTKGAEWMLVIKATQLSGQL
jgi:hypothetical protein